MKAFIILSLAATALAVPARGGGRRPGGNKKEKVDPGNILRCTAENFGNNQTIKDCIDCFSAEMDFSSQAGLVHHAVRAIDISIPDRPSTAGSTSG